MKIPKQIKVGAYTIPVEVMDYLESRGVYETEELKIRVKKDMDKQQRFSTFIHEWLEVVNDCYDLKLENGDHWKIMVLEQETTRLITQLNELWKND